jgi:hypothetical protein
MKIKADKRLFWFLKDNVKLDLNDPSQLDMYLQQVITYGRTEDIKKTLKLLGYKTFKESFLRIRYFLPFEIRSFWEDFFEVAPSQKNRFF